MNDFNKSKNTMNFKNFSQVEIGKNHNVEKSYREQFFHRENYNKMINN